MRKCRSYLDLHHPELLYMDDYIILRCCYIFDTLLRFADGCEIDDNVSMWRELKYPTFSKWDMQNTFNNIFYNTKLIIVNMNPNHEDSYISSTSLYDLLTDDDKFAQFKSYWTNLHSYDSLCKLMQKITSFPDELIHLIVIQLF